MLSISVPAPRAILAGARATLTRKTTEPTVLVGCAISFVFHLGIIVVGLAWPRAPLVRADTAETDVPTVVVLDTWDHSAVEAAVPEEPPSPTPVRQSAPKPTRTHAVLVSRDDAHGTDVPATYLPESSHDEQMEKDLDELEAAPAKDVDVRGETPTVPVFPAHISPELARRLRVHDVFPSVSELTRLGRAKDAVLVKICVSGAGAVQDVAVLRGGDGRLAGVLGPAIRTWRYRALVVDGAATSFCHAMRIEYQYGTR